MAVLVPHWDTQACKVVNVNRCYACASPLPHKRSSPAPRTQRWRWGYNCCCLHMHSYASWWYTVEINRDPREDCPRRPRPAVAVAVPFAPCCLPTPSLSPRVRWPTARLDGAEDTDFKGDAVEPSDRRSDPPPPPRVPDEAPPRSSLRGVECGGSACHPRSERPEPERAVPSLLRGDRPSRSTRRDDLCLEMRRRRRAALRACFSMALRWCTVAAHTSASAHSLSTRTTCSSWVAAMPCMLPC